MTDAQMDEVVGRVREAVDRGFVSWRWTEDEPVVFDSADLRALLAAYQSVREDTARLEAIVAKRLTIGECEACERDGEYRISVEAPSGCGHCNPPTLEGIRDGIDAALKMHPNHFARTGGTE
jgi:hypothetical protein